jgi:hypothetical protein
MSFGWPENGGCHTCDTFANIMLLLKNLAFQDETSELVTILYSRS